MEELVDEQIRRLQQVKDDIVLIQSHIKDLSKRKEELESEKTKIEHRLRMHELQRLERLEPDWSSLESFPWSDEILRSPQYVNCMILNLLVSALTLLK
jgi:hypothetical protein